jgi:hypothetical protein
MCRRGLMQVAHPPHMPAPQPRRDDPVDIPETFDYFDPPVFCVTILEEGLRTNALSGGGGCRLVTDGLVSGGGERQVAFSC